MWPISTKAISMSLFLPIIPRRRDFTASGGTRHRPVAIDVAFCAYSMKLQPMNTRSLPMFTLKARGFFDFRAAFLGHADDADF